MFMRRNNFNNNNTNNRRFVPNLKKNNKIENNHENNLLDEVIQEIPERCSTNEIIELNQENILIKQGEQQGKEGEGGENKLEEEKEQKTLNNSQILSHVDSKIQQKFTNSKQSVSNNITNLDSLRLNLPINNNSSSLLFPLQISKSSSSPLITEIQSNKNNKNENIGDVENNCIENNLININNTNFKNLSSNKTQIHINEEYLIHQPNTSSNGFSLLTEKYPNTQHNNDQINQNSKKKRDAIKSVQNYLEYISGSKSSNLNSSVERKRKRNIVSNNNSQLQSASVSIYNTNSFNTILPSQDQDIYNNNNNNYENNNNYTTYDNLYYYTIPNIAEENCYLLLTRYVKRRRQGLGLRLKNISGRAVIGGFSEEYLINHTPSDATDIRIGDIIMAVENIDTSNPVLCPFNKVVKYLITFGDNCQKGNGQSMTIGNDPLQSIQRLTSLAKYQDTITIRLARLSQNINNNNNNNNNSRNNANIYHTCNLFHDQNQNIINNQYEYHQSEQQQQQ